MRNGMHTFEVNDDLALQGKDMDIFTRGMLRHAMAWS
jgi:hypothetical protein